MLSLLPMNEAEFKSFMEISTADHIRSQVKAGYWHPAEADENMQKLRDQILPQGKETPDHYFMKIRNDEEGQIGGLWYMVTENAGKRMIFVVDIQVHDQFRRRGYGTQAFALMEDQAQERGITTIALNVFEHNHPAKAMYEKLGYAGAGENMVKELKPSDDHF